MKIVITPKKQQLMQIHQLQNCRQCIQIVGTTLQWKQKKKRKQLSNLPVFQHSKRNGRKMEIEFLNDDHFLGGWHDKKLSLLCSKHPVIFMNA